MISDEHQVLCVAANCREQVRLQDLSRLRARVNIKVKSSTRAETLTSSQTMTLGCRASSRS
jgi:hypothetical protein